MFNPRGVRIPQKSNSVYDFSETPFDLDFAIKHIKNRFEGSKLFLVGVSMGASYGVQYLSRLNKDKKIEGMVSIANPFNLNDSSHSLVMPMNYIYGYYLTRCLIDKVNFNLPHIEKINKKRKLDFSFEELNKKHNTFDYDKDFTLKFSGFKNSVDYYNALSCDKDFKTVDVPLLVINSKNDPIAL